MFDTAGRRVGGSAGRPVVNHGPLRINEPPNRRSVEQERFIASTGALMTDDTRRASLAYQLTDVAGIRSEQGRGEAVIDDEGLAVGPVTVSFLDAERLQAADYK